MPVYNYSARNAQGQTVSGTQEADSEFTIIKSLQNQNLVVIKIADSAERRLNTRNQKKKRHRVKNEDLLLLMSQTAILLNAGIPLLRALTVISGEVQSEKLADALNQIRDNIRAGSSFKDAVARHPSVFPTMWVYLIEAGELSGNLPFVLNRIAIYLESSEGLRRKVLSAMIYPIILVVAATGVILIFLLYVIPIVSKIFDQFHTKLHPLTQVLINMSNGMRHYFVFVLIVAGGLVYLARNFLSTPAAKQMMDRLALKVPIFGHFITDAVLARIAMNFSVLLKSGVDILHALDVVARSSGNYVYESALMGIRTDVQQGKRLSESISRYQIFPTMLYQMVLVGEEAGMLADMMERVAKYHEARVEVFTSRLGSLIEPIVILIMGGIVLVLALAMFLPIISLTTSIR